MSDATIRKPRSQQELREAAIEFWHRVATPGQTGLVLVDGEDDAGADALDDDCLDGAEAPRGAG